MPVNNDLTSGLVAALRRHEPRVADALVDTYGGRAESPRPHILEACPTAGPRRTSNKEAVGGTNDGCDDSGSADPPPRHLRQGRSRRSHGRLLTRVAAVHSERDAEWARGHSAAVHHAVQGVRQARSVVPDAEAGRRRGHRLHPVEGRDGGQPLRDRDGYLRGEGWEDRHPDLRGEDHTEALGVRKDGGGRSASPAVFVTAPAFGGRAESARRHKGCGQRAFIRPPYT